jgi:hypothetical protein
VPILCGGCSFDLRLFPGSLTLDSQFRSIFCPICGAKVLELREAPRNGIFYDDQTGSYAKWVSSGKAEENIVLEELILDPVGQAEPPAFVVTVQAKTVAYSKIFYDFVLVFFLDNHLVPPQLFAPPENCRRYAIQIESAQLLQNSNFVEVTFRLKGGYRDTIVIPAAPTQGVPDLRGNIIGGSALKLWPQFRRPRWKEYFVYFATSDPFVSVEYLRVFGEGPKEEATFLGSTPRGRFTFPPSFIEICARVTKEGIPPRTYKASFKMDLLDLKAVPPAGDKRCCVAVDFGTSNTYFSYSLSGSDPEALELSDKTRTLIDGLHMELDLAHTWFPELSKQKLLPSELLFSEAPDNAFNERQELRPIVDYTIPPLKWREKEEKQIVTGFKWEHAVTPSTVRAHYKKLQQMFLELALRLALAEVVQRIDTQASAMVDPFRIGLIITYPLAMSEPEFRQLCDSYDAVRSALEESTGVILEEVATIDESYAGEIGTRAVGATHSIFVDVGGGTTDMSVVEVSVDEDGGFRRPQFVDSVQFAGNDFLQALVSGDYGDKNRISSKSLIELERRIRLKDSNVFKDSATFANAARRTQGALKVLKRFLDGLTEYLARAIAVHVASQSGPSDKKQKLDVYLLGNGWRFAEMESQVSAIRDERDTPTIVREEIGKKLSDRLAKLLQAGVISDIPQFDIHLPIDPKSVVSCGALLVYLNNPSTGISANRQMSKPKTFLGSNVDIATPGKILQYRWNVEVPFNVGANIKIDGVFIAEPLAGFERTSVPVPVDSGTQLSELKSVNISRALLEGNSIARSAFNCYLERWYKTLLHPSSG